MTRRPVYSIIAPVYNEEGNIQPLYDRISAVMEALGEPWELIMVNDGSQDHSLQLMRELQARAPQVRVLSFSRNFGHQRAGLCGWAGHHPYRRGSAGSTGDHPPDD